MMSARKPLGYLLLAYLSGTAVAHAQATLALVGATITDVGQDPSQYVGSIVIERDRIVQVGRLDDVVVPESVEQIDLTGKFIIPGLIDGHVHFLAFGGPGLDEALESFPRWGVTAVFDAAGNANSFGTLKRLASEAGTPRARYFGVGTSFSPGLNATPAAEDVVAAIEAAGSAGADAIKLFHSDTNTRGLPSPGDLYSPETLATIFDESRARSLPVIVHASGKSTAEDVLRLGAHALMHGIYDQLFDDPFLAAMQQAGSYYVPTHSLLEEQADTISWSFRLAEFDRSGAVPQSTFDALRNGAEASLDASFPLREKLQNLRENLRRVHRAGIPIVMGTDTFAGTNRPLGIASQIELALYVEVGLTEAEALRTATVHPAAMIGASDDLGSISEGKLADLVVLSADPLRDIRNIREIEAVYVGGILVE